MCWSPPWSAWQLEEPGLPGGEFRAVDPPYTHEPASISLHGAADGGQSVRRTAREQSIAGENRMQWKRGEVMGVWVWLIVAWIILAWVFGDFWWFRPLMRELR